MIYEAKPPSLVFRDNRDVPDAFFFFLHSSAFAEKQKRQSDNQAVARQLAQAAHYRQETKELQQTIERYRIMHDIYEKGSKERVHGFNRLGRQRMVKRTERLIQYFTQAKQDMEQLAAEHEAMAKALRTSHKCPEKEAQHEKYGGASPKQPPKSNFEIR